MGRRRRNGRAERPARPTALGLARERTLLRWQEWASLGISSSQVSASLTRVAPGVYAALCQQVSATLIASKRVPRGTLCLLSAAHFHGLAVEPAEVWLALGRKDWRPRLRTPVLRTVRFSGPALTEGVEQHCRWGVPVRVYSVAKTVTDLFRYQEKVGLSAPAFTMGRALRLGRCTVDELRILAVRFGVEPLMAPYLEVAARMPVLPIWKRPPEGPTCSCHWRTATGRLVPCSPEPDLAELYGGMSDQEAMEPLSPERQALSDRLRRKEEEEPEPLRVQRLEATP